MRLKQSQQFSFQRLIECRRDGLHAMGIVETSGLGFSRDGRRIPARNRKCPGDRVTGHDVVKPLDD